MRRARRPRALVLGAITRDLILEERGTRGPRPGGVVHYAGLTLAALGAEVRVVTRCHPGDANELLAPLRGAGVEVRALPSRATTVYLNDYRHGTDRHLLQACSDPIEPADVPEEWRESDLVQLGPLHPRDVLAETVDGLSGFIGLDVQGFFRDPDVDGRPVLCGFLSRVGMLQTSDADLDSLLRGASVRSFMEEHGLGEWVVTRGARGCSVFTSHAEDRIPAQPLRGGERVGLGDRFLAAYLHARVGGATPIEAARRASGACVRILETGVVPRDRTA